MNCPQCATPMATDFLDGNPDRCYANLRIHRAEDERDCLRRALANRDGEIATLKAAADSSFAFRAALVEEVQRLTVALTAKANTDIDLARARACCTRPACGACLACVTRQRDEKSAHVDKLQSKLATARAEVTRLESLLAIERGRVAATCSDARADGIEFAPCYPLVKALAEVVDLRARLTAAEQEIVETKRERAEAIEAERGMHALFAAASARLTAAEGDAGRMRAANREALRYVKQAILFIASDQLDGEITRTALQRLDRMIGECSPPTGHAAGEALIDEIRQERKRQETKWGEQNARFRLGDWMSCLTNIALKARAKSDIPGETRRELVKLVALVMRAINAVGGHTAGEVEGDETRPKCGTCGLLRMDGEHMMPSHSPYGTATTWHHFPNCPTPPPVVEVPTVLRWRQARPDGDEADGRYWWFRGTLVDMPLDKPIVCFVFTDADGDSFATVVDGNDVVALDLFDGDWLPCEVPVAEGVFIGAVEAPPVDAPSDERPERCNRHANCAEADHAALQAAGVKAVHCDTPRCDCSNEGG